MLGKSSFFFLEKAREFPNTSDQHRYYLVSSLTQSWLLLEAYLNDISDLLAKAKIDKFEKAILQHKGLAINEFGEIFESTSHLPTLKRALFVLNYFSRVDVKKLRKTKLWQEISWAECYRNELIHPKQFNLDQLDIRKAERVRKCVIDFIHRMNREVLSKDILLD
jgi:hypothetical protein